MFKSTRVDLGEVVAVKVLKNVKDLKRIKKNKASAGLQNELLNCVRHQTIIEILNSNINSCRLVLEFAEGSDLCKKVSRFR